ncbi:hypothetical protein CTA2_7414 [Colletotrichum tanaceti]|uniref:Uncharacterized protein n=1 Tax=Colletotrichum tanaceti TaxID=1306861 RepID=A0A4U6XCI2_9PEZI|nr:hypothetical protein CTA2_7414 [Colletotrichum tanaceti]TKW52812.1 hypothetical protein CTA1_11997 [Colletotrichum tanaceti]
MLSAGDAGSRGTSEEGPLVLETLLAGVSAAGAQPHFVGPRGENSHPEGFVISEADHDPPLQITAEDKEVDEQWDEDTQGGEEVDYFPDVLRTEPLADRIEPMLSAFASAVKNMGALEDAELFAYLAWYPSKSRSDEYGDEAPYDCENGMLIQWQVGDWRPSQSMLGLFEYLGRQK